MTNFFVYKTRLIKPIKASKIRLEALGSMTDSSKPFIEPKNKKKQKKQTKKKHIL